MNKRQAFEFYAYMAVRSGDNEGAYSPTTLYYVGRLALLYKGWVDPLYPDEQEAWKCTMTDGIAAADNWYI